jgi:hypothetical protein
LRHAGGAGLIVLPHPAFEGAPAGRPFLIAAWWLTLACAGLAILIVAGEFLPPKYGNDSATIRAYMEARDLWEGLTFDGWVNTARVWSLVFYVLPEALVMPACYCVLVGLVMRLLDVYEVRSIAYQLLAGAWVVCIAFFVSGVSKEMIAVPVALFFCLAGSRASRLAATVLLLLYAAFFRNYWAICYYYFLVLLLAMKLHVANRSRLAAVVLLLGFIAPFVATDAFNLGALTDARSEVNVDHVDNPDRRSAFDNAFENTGFATDVANAAVAWWYMNVPVALLREGVPHYLFFFLFQLCSVWFFAAGCARFLQDAKTLGRADSSHVRCAAFVIAFSLTQALFEPDFGSFLRHEMVVMVPMLILVFYRAHATQWQTGAAAAQEHDLAQLTALAPYRTMAKR